MDSINSVSSIWRGATSISDVIFWFLTEWFLFVMIFSGSLASIFENCMFDFEIQLFSKSFLTLVPSSTRLIAKLQTYWFQIKLFF